MSELNDKINSAKKFYNKRHFEEAYKLYWELANEGHLHSQVFLGWLYDEGIGTPQDKKQAEYWYKSAASTGDGRGAFYYGRCLTAQYKHKEAFDWYVNSANTEFVPGIFRVGYSYSRGFGAPSNSDLSYQYLFRAAEAGHIFAQRELALLDLKGERGLLFSIIGFFSMLYIVIKGFVIAMIKPYSDSLLT